MESKKRMKNCLKTRCCLIKLDRLARAKTWSLERPDTRNPRSSKEKLARAKNAMLQVHTRRNRSLELRKSGSSHQTQNTTLARATKYSLERPTQKLDSNTWFPNPTNLKQTCPTHPITPNKKIKNDNNNYTMTESTEPKSGYNNQMEKDRGRQTKCDKAVLEFIFIMH